MSSIAKFRRVLKGQVGAGAAGFTEYWTDAEIGQACGNGSVNRLLNGRSVVGLSVARCAKIGD